jgi:DNA polymerase delta subunit 4
MPPTRRSRTSSGPAPKGSQKTLSFGNTKSSTPLPKSGKPTPSPLSKAISIKPEESEEEENDVGHITSEAAVQQQAKVEVEAVKRSPEEEKASKVTDAQVKKYWREREAERRSPRVHQGELSVEEKVLRYWDMSSQYGVSAPFVFLFVAC